MIKLPLLALLAALVLPAFALPVFAADPPAPATPAPAGEKTDKADQEREAKREERRQERTKRLIEENPELKGVDPNTPEGKEKIQQTMRARFEKEVAPQIRKRIAEAQAANHAQLQEDFAMTAEEFTAIEPLLIRVEQLRMQKGLVDAPTQMRNMGFGGGRGGRGGQGGGGGWGGGFDPKMFLGDTAMEPSVQECQTAAKALTTLLADKQANAAEVAAATARVRKARAAFQASLDKAQGELKGVLTPRQEALLVDHGILD